MYNSPIYCDIDKHYCENCYEKFKSTKNREKLFLKPNKGTMNIAFNISDERYKELDTFVDKLIEKNDYKPNIIMAIWNNKSFTDKEALLLVYLLGDIK